MIRFLACLMGSLFCFSMNSYAADGENTVALKTDHWPATFINSQGQRYVFLAGGSFQMGVEPPQYKDQSPQHAVSS